MGLLTGSRGNLAERLCRENGWGIDERHGSAIGLHFRGDHITPQRTVYVSASASSLAFAVPSQTDFSEYDLPDGLLEAMLFRNDDVGMGGWAAKEVGGKVSLILQYACIASSLDAHGFKSVVTALLSEVADLEAHLSRKGLI